ncbi:MAG: glycosyltransferase [Anaeroplasmataceae bacterium]|nr:glycosyltransferase [Anaeroplasmataceae bacterium]
MNIWDYIVQWWNQTFNFSDVPSIYRSITNIILYAFGILLFYRSIYVILGFFGKAPKYKQAQMDKTYAVVISARNEEKVIGNLIDSILKQTYDSSKITIFVVADNCTDCTAEVCRSLGAIVFERQDTQHVSKGFALEFLFEQIQKNYGITSFDYFLFFDADNLLKNDFIEKMNDCFATGYDIVTSFRNIKNFDTNIISSGYGIHFYRNTLCSHRPRSIIGASTNVTGTGYGVKSEYVKDGWHFTNLTEDAEFTTVSISKNLRIGYCEAAEIYDEQPTDFKTAWKQRLRWRKGGLINFKNNSFKLFKNFLKTGKWSSYDMFWHTFPYDLISFLLALIVQIVGMVYSLVTLGSYDVLIFLKYLGGFILGSYICSIGIGILVVLKEHKRIHCGFFKMLFFLLMWPWFDLISVIIVLCALFKRIQWDPIAHKDSKRIEEMKE